MSSNGFSPYSRDGQRDPLAKNLLAPGLPRGDDQASPDATGNIGISQAFILREFERASLRLVERRFETGDVIYAPGDSDDRLYFLLSGAIRIYRPYGCFKEATTALLVDEGVFGRLDLPEAGSQEDFAEALTGARVAQLRKASVVWLVKRRPEVALALFSVLAERSRRSEERVANLLPREVSRRLAILLLNLGERLGEEDESGAVALRLRLPHRELASMIASTREAVSKAMSDLRRDGLIDVRNRSIVLLDRATLYERAEGEARADGSRWKGKARRHRSPGTPTRRGPNLADQKGMEPPRKRP